MAKNIRREMHNKRSAETAERLMRRVVGDCLSTDPLPVLHKPGTPEYAAEELRDVMKLPAAESAVFKFAHAETLHEKIEEHMRSGDPELEMHAMDVSTKLITSIVKAQKKAASPITINQQINTGGVPIAGTPGHLASRSVQVVHESAPSTPSADPSSAGKRASSQSSGE